MEAVKVVRFVMVVCVTMKGNTCFMLQPDDNIIPQFEPTVVHKWVTISYNIPANMSYHQYRMTYPFDYRNNILGGIGVHKGEIYVTIPRISPGVSATLNRVIEKDGTSLLEAFPNWEWQTIGDCDALQSVNNIVIDPVKEWMWIIDTGRVNTFWGGVRNLCPPKLIIYDLKEQEIITSYEFPSSVANHTNSFLSNIAIDPEAGYAFIPNTVEGQLIFFSLSDNYSIGIDHPMFKFEKGNNSITVNERTIILAAVSAHIYGIAMSPRRDFILFSHLGGKGLYRMSTEFFRKIMKNPSHVSEVGNYIKCVGYKVAQSMSLLMGQNSVYYGALGKQAVYDWKVDDLLSYPDVSEDLLSRVPRAILVADERMYWIDTITLDAEGVMWITSSNLVRYFLDVMDYHDNFNYFIWKVKTGDESYLTKKTSPLKPKPVTTVHTSTVQGGGKNAESWKPVTTVHTSTVQGGGKNAESWKPAAVTAVNTSTVHDSGKNAASWNELNIVLLAMQLVYSAFTLTVK